MRKEAGLAVIAFLGTGISLFAQQAKPLWGNKAFAVYGDKVIQGKYTAVAVSGKELTSDYQSPANLFKSNGISFKFSINGKDNEMKSGMDHHFIVAASSGENETPLIKFGDPAPVQSSAPAGYLSPQTALTIRADMREVLASFKANGYFVAFNKDTIYKQDFNSLYVAGGSAPLIWDFNNLHNHPELEMKDPDGDGIYQTTVVLNKPDNNNQTATAWKLAKNTSAFPQYSSPFPLSDAVYNLSLEEMMKAVEPDSTFRTGKEWAGVWTRDISYSIILSMAYLQPRVAMYSLLKKVNKKKKIIQDTGTGGAWPCSTDRMIWAVAAWELYKVTGDKDWLQQAFTIINASLQDDYLNAYDKATGLVRGESSFLDWREQTYPTWMQPVDIYESQNLGTNAVHYQANIVAAKMASLLGRNEEAKKFNAVAQKIKTGINTYLWMGDKGYYAQYLYGRTSKTVSPRSEALGEALSVLFDVADERRAKQVIGSTPVTEYGIPCIYPQIPDIPPYHNNAVWPFVQTYWMWASAKAGNEDGVMESIAAIYRPAALWLTNKENFVAESGDYQGTQINSSNMLWSLSGNISIIHKVLFGIRFNESDLAFEPFVPKAFAGSRSLTNFKYRQAVLDINMEGYGNRINSFLVDGKEVATHKIPATLTGKHNIKIGLQNNTFEKAKINTVENYTSLPAPALTNLDNVLSWPKVTGAIRYGVIKNGRLLMNTNDTTVKINSDVYAEYAVVGIDEKGISSFISEPVAIENSNTVNIYEVEASAPKADYKYKGFSGAGFTDITTDKNTVVEVPVTIAEAANYILDCRYANGNGPINTENKCAIRTVMVDGKALGVFVLPQRGTGEWSNWGMSNSLQAALTPGKHIITIEYLPDNENMNGAVNEAMLDYIRVIKKSGSGQNNTAKK